MAGDRGTSSAGRERFFAECSSADIIKPGAAAKHLSSANSINSLDGITLPAGKLQD
jgi:hypothetical protein